MRVVLAEVDRSGLVRERPPEQQVLVRLWATDKALAESGEERLKDLAGDVLANSDNEEVMMDFFKKTEGMTWARMSARARREQITSFRKFLKEKAKEGSDGWTSTK